MLSYRENIEFLFKKTQICNDYSMWCLIANIFPPHPNILRISGLLIEVIYACAHRLAPKGKKC